MASRSIVLVAFLSVSLLGSLGLSAPVAAAPPAGAGAGSGGSGGSGPEEEACADRSLGDACTLPNDSLGTCAQATCNRLDYSGGSPPKAIEEACVVCKPGGAQPHDDRPMLGGDDGADSNPPDSNPASNQTKPSETKEPPKSESRCRVDTQGSSPAGLALLAGLLFGVRRRAQAKRRPSA